MPASGAAHAGAADAAQGAASADPWGGKVGRDRVGHADAVTVVAVVGGTHGNERTGFELVRHYGASPDRVARPSFATDTLVANEKAVACNRRYVGKDLNRCFLVSDLESSSSRSDTQTDYAEVVRAAEINALLGPKLSARTDFVLDCHTTTANTGVAIMFAPDDELALEVAAYLQCCDPDVRIVMWSAESDWPMLPSVGKSGVTVEVGPVPTGCVSAEVYARMDWAVQGALDYLHERNLALGALNASAGQAKASGGGAAKKPRRIGTVVRIYRRVGTVDYPREPGGRGLAAMVHEDLQGQDFVKPLTAGGSGQHGDRDAADDCVFRTWSGESVLFEAGAMLHRSGAESVWHAGGYVPLPPCRVLYPFFVNEAAYYEKGVAFAVARRDDAFVTFTRGVDISKPPLSDRLTPG